MDSLGGPQLRHAGLNLADDPREKREHVESDVFGFWIFLMSDAVLFALLFAIYGTSLDATAGDTGPAQEFKIGSAFTHTMRLLLHLRHGVHRAEARCAFPPFGALAGSHVPARPRLSRHGSA